MNRLMKATAVATAIALLTGTLATSGFAAAADANAKAARPSGEVMRTIVGRDEGGWAVVDISRVTGEVVVLSPVVGPSIDIEESISLAMFHGRNTFNRGTEIPALSVAIPGFQEAVFFRRPEGRYAIRIAYTAGNELRYRQIPLRGFEDLLLLREYVENFDAIAKGDYRLNRKPRLTKEDEYPKQTDREIEFEMRRPRFVLSQRVDGTLILKDGSELSGELVPVYDDGQIMISEGFDVHRVATETIDRLRLRGNKSASALGTAFRTGVGMGMTGALAGALAGWQSDGDVGRFVLYGATFFAAAGFLTGLLRGAGSGQANRDIKLGPVDKKDDEEEEPGPGIETGVGMY